MNLEWLTKRINPAPFRVWSLPLDRKLEFHIDDEMLLDISPDVVQAAIANYLYNLELSK